MNRFARLSLIMPAVLLLSGCGSMPDFDPTEWVNIDFLNNKKPLPGVRKPVFPDGVPGVTQGVPPDLVKGHQPAAGIAQDQTLQETAVASPGEEASAERAAVEAEPAPPKPKAKAKPKPKPRVAAKPAPVEPEGVQRAPTPVTVRRSNSQWPDPPATQQAQPQQQQPATQWPDPPRAPGSASGGVQWPDPPAPH